MHLGCGCLAVLSEFCWAPFFYFLLFLFFSRKISLSCSPRYSLFLCFGFRPLDPSAVLCRTSQQMGSFLLGNLLHFFYNSFPKDVLPWNLAVTR